MSSCPDVFKFATFMSGVLYLIQMYVWLKVFFEYFNICHVIYPFGIFILFFCSHILIK